MIELDRWTQLFCCMSEYPRDLAISVSQLQRAEIAADADRRRCFVWYIYAEKMEFVRRRKFLDMLIRKLNWWKGYSVAYLTATEISETQISLRCKSPELVTKAWVVMVRMQWHATSRRRKRNMSESRADHIPTRQSEEKIKGNGRMMDLLHISSLRDFGRWTSEYTALPWIVTKYGSVFWYWTCSVGHPCLCSCVWLRLVGAWSSARINKYRTWLSIIHCSL